jgi:hypothetical protein
MTTRTAVEVESKWDHEYRHAVEVFGVWTGALAAIAAAIVVSLTLAAARGDAQTSPEEQVAAYRP